MIIVEGPRQSGKTILVDTLALEFHLPIYSYSYTPVGADHYNIREIIKDVRSWTAKPTGLYDGHPLISEYIYGPILRKKILLSFKDWTVRPIIKHLSETAVIIYCRPSNIDKDDPALSLYDLILHTPLTQFRVWEYDYTADPEASKLLIPVSDFLETMHVRKFKTTKFGWPWKTHA
ncbi:MAG: hypothetical protein LC778_10165 [Acidobacteria bacterium]|nr:hypothetical protein [Acidobacteriota bacterium]